MTNATHAAGPVAVGKGLDRLRRVDQRLAALVGLLVLAVIVFSFAAPGFGTVSNLLNVGRQSATLIVVGVGLSLILLAGELDLSVGAVVALVATIVAQAVTAWSVPTPVAILIGLAAGALVGVVNGLLTLAVKIPSFLATLGTLSILQGLALVVSISPVAVHDGTLSALFLGDLAGIPRVLFYAAVVVAAAVVLTRRSQFGLWTRAVGSGDEMSRLAGLPVARQKFMVFVIGGLCSAIGGVILVGRTGFGEALSTPSLGIDALAAVILGGTRLGGGKGSIAGTIVAALLIGVISSGVQGMGLSSAGQDITRGVVIGAAVLFMRRSR